MRRGNGVGGSDHVEFEFINQFGALTDGVKLPADSAIRRGHPAQVAPLELQVARGWALSAKGCTKRKARCMPLLPAKGGK